MKRISPGVLAVMFTVGLGLTFVPAASRGAEASGEIPVLFNDHHVDVVDRLKKSRVLTALVRGSTILVPLRSIFEQMGAAVAFDPATKTVAVSKPGSDVTVTVGKPEVVINGETRPLDVPPEIDDGIVLVPLRVLSEGMGAYVAWLPEKRLVVVRYLQAPAPTPPPPPAPAATAPPEPSPSAPPASAIPAPAKAASKYERFVVGDYIFSPKVYNELSAGQGGKSSFKAVAAVEFPLLHLPWMLEGDVRSYRFTHNANGTGVCGNGDPGCATTIGSGGSVYLPSFQARNDDFDGRFGLKVANPRIYVGVGYLFRNSNYEGGGFPTQQHGASVGIEKLPDLNHAFSLYGSVFYYPNVTTNNQQDLGDGTDGSVQYRVLKYSVGATFNFGNSPFFLDLGYLGDNLNVIQNAPIDQTHGGAYAGLGIHF